MTPQTDGVTTRIKAMTKAATTSPAYPSTSDLQPSTLHCTKGQGKAHVFLSHLGSVVVFSLGKKGKGELQANGLFLCLFVYLFFKRDDFCTEENYDQTSAYINHQLNIHGFSSNLQIIGADKHAASRIVIALYKVLQQHLVHYSINVVCLGSYYGHRRR